MKGVITLNQLGEMKKEGVSIAGTMAGGGGSYTLPIATTSALGGVKVGTGLSITSEGVLSTSGDLGNVTILSGTLNSTGEHTLRNDVESFDYVIGYVEATYSGEGNYRFPIGYYRGSDQLNCWLQGNNLRLRFDSSGASDISYKLYVGNLITIS